MTQAAVDSPTDSLSEDDHPSNNAPDPDFNFSSIFDAASKLKSAQLSKIRKEYESSPSFIKATQVYADRNNEWKELSIVEKLEKCVSLKEKGNECFKSGQSMQALNFYSEALSIFRYFEKKDERGEHLELKDFIADGYLSDIWHRQEHYDQAKMLVVALLLNCAAVCFSLREHANVIWSCQTVLKYDASNAKALYRMCQSHQRLDTTFDLEMAFKYISKAKAIDPKNKVILYKFNEIKKTLQKQNQKDRKHFHGLFNRGSLYDDKQNVAVLSDSSDAKGTGSRIKRCCDKVLACVLL